MCQNKKFNKTKKVEAAVVTVTLDGDVFDDCPECVTNFTAEVAQSVGVNATDIIVNITFDEESATTVVVFLLVNLNCDNTTSEIEYFFNTSSAVGGENISVSCEITIIGKKKKNVCFFFFFIS